MCLAPDIPDPPPPPPPAPTAPKKKPTIDKLEPAVQRGLGGVFKSTLSRLKIPLNV